MGNGCFVGGAGFGNAYTGRIPLPCHIVGMDARGRMDYFRIVAVLGLDESRQLFSSQLADAATDPTKLFGSCRFHGFSDHSVR